MQLNEWLEKTGHTRKWFAGELGVSKRRIDTILYGADPRLIEVMLIEQITSGAVKSADWIEREIK